MLYKCPYCLYSFRKGEELAERLNEDIVVQLCPNPAMAEDSEQKKCGRRLPLNFMKSESKVIALAGAANVGKTYYYLALLKQLKFNTILHEIGIIGDTESDEDATEKINHFYEEINNGTRLLATTSIKNALQSVIHLRITRGDQVKHVYLSFFDTPGEKFTDQDYMLKNLPHVYKADGLLFLFEPKQIKKLWKTIIRDNSYLRAENAPENLYKVLDTIIEVIRHVRANHPGGATGGSGKDKLLTQAWEDFVNSLGRQKLPVPVALAVSKFDQLEKSMNVTIPFDDTDFETMCIKKGRFDEKMINTISSEIAQSITGMPDGEPGIEQLLRSSLADYAFFGVKSVDVDEVGKPIYLHPQGVLLPLIWLLIKLRLY